MVDAPDSKSGELNSKYIKLKHLKLLVFLGVISNIEYSFLFVKMYFSGEFGGAKTLHNTKFISRCCIELQVCYNLLEVLKLNTEITQTKLNLLPIITDNSFFAETKSNIDLNYAKSIVGNIIYFNWKHDGLDESISGKVLDIIDNKLRIYINYVFMFDEDLKDADYLKNNPYITDIPIIDISNVFVNNKFMK